MSMKPTLTMSQKQLLVMTPKLQQAIKILQMPRLELAQYITQQMLENPVLEEAEDEIMEETTEEENGSEDLEDTVDADLETGLPDTDVISEDDLPEMDITSEEFGDINWEEYFEDSDLERSEWEEPLEDDRRSDIPAPEESLQEHLLWQLRMSVTSEDDLHIGEAIIGEIDDDGYLTTDVKEIADMLGKEVSEVERVLQIIQTFDPAGVGARDLKECLLIQLQQLGHTDSVAFRLVKEGYLEELEANRLPQIAKSLGVELELVKAAFDAIRSLEPKPGRQFDSRRPEVIEPDIIVEKIDGKYTVLMDDYGPRLRLRPYYQDLLISGNSLSDETREYIRSKIQSAEWFLESIERRRRTILKVADSIFSVQKDFLEKGPKFLKPLTLKEIADMVGVHEATVSRVVRNRYAQTPQGVFELKHFFSSSIPTKDGGVASSTSIKEMIKNLIDNEDPKNPLSDKDIESILDQKGIKIARRTIAKYREELNILPSTKRKHW